MAKGKGKTKFIPNQPKTKSPEEQDLQLRNLHQKMSGPISKLPMDLIIDVLSRVPIKTLKRVAKSVKPLLNLITLPRFALIHHTRTIRSATDSSPSLLVPNQHHQYFLINYDEIESLLGADLNSFEALTPIKSIFRIKKNGMNDPDQGYYVVGSCNGLLCMAPMHGSTFLPLLISNPVTSDYMFLPNSTISRRGRDSFSASGFGFDARTGEYKVIVIFKRENFEGEVFTLGSDVSWRVIPDIRYAFYEEDFSVFVAGALHWIGYNSEGVQVIVSFQLGTEEFGEMSLPAGVETDPVIFHFGVFGREHLFLASGSWRTSDERNIEIWVQEEYEVQASWTRRYIVNWDVVGFNVKIGKFSPQINECGFMSLMKNGEILWLNNHGFGYYNPQEGSFRLIQISFKASKHVFPFYHLGKMFPDAHAVTMFPVAHAESLISPWYVGELKKSLSMNGHGIDGI